MKSSGICPKCKSSDIVTDEGRGPNGQRAFVMITAFSSIKINTYFCLACGFMEEYIEKDAFQNTVKMEKLRTKWKKP